MKVTNGGKRYDTEKARVIAERDLYSHSNNYAGTVRLGVASDGAYLLWTSSNGQDCHITDDIAVVSLSDAQVWLESAVMDEDQEALAAKLGLIEIVA
jgi:hypothetical protein